MLNGIDKIAKIVYTMYILIMGVFGMTTTIQKWGNGRGVRIPKFLLDAVQWSDNEQIVLSADKNKIIIEKAEPRKNIVELFVDFEGEYVPVEMDWGEPTGEEVW